MFICSKMPQCNRVEKKCYFLYNYVTNVINILLYLQADDVVPESEAGEFVDYQTNMVKCCKAIIKLSQDMVSSDHVIYM